MALEPGDPRHGANGYMNYGCRCDVCRTDHSEYHLGVVAFRTERLKADPTLATHGKRSTYTNWGCRCADCTRAHRDYRRAERQRKFDRDSRST